MLSRIRKKQQFRSSATFYKDSECNRIPRTKRGTSCCSMLWLLLYDILLWTYQHKFNMHWLKLMGTAARYVEQGSECSIEKCDKRCAGEVNRWLAFSDRCSLKQYSNRMTRKIAAMQQQQHSVTLYKSITLGICGFWRDTTFTLKIHSKQQHKSFKIIRDGFCGYLWRL